MCKNGWNQILDSPITNKILHFLEREYKNNIPIFPTQENVFNAFKECAYKDLRVVMLGQDPYPQPGYATGLLFANPIGTKELSPSLKLVIDRI
jgi:uracil-DNA glycosylase